MRQTAAAAVFAIISAFLTGAAPAQAAVETWVSANGNDAGNACAITAPCRTFAYAHSKTFNGGTINVLTPGNFGPLTITKGISIVAEGVEALINTAGVDGATIFVQAGATHVVSLRGLTIDTRGNHDINFVSGAALHVHNSVIRGATNGIRFQPGSGTRELTVAHSVIADNSEGGGIFIIPSGSGGAKVMLDRVRVENGANTGIWFSGLQTSGPITATVRDSVSTGNVDTGIFVEGCGSSTVTVMVDRSASVNNDYGIFVSGAGAGVRVGESTMTGNVTGLYIDSNAVMQSYGTNKIDGNGTDTLGTIGTATYK